MSGVEVLLPTSTFGGVMERETFAGGGGGGTLDQMMLDTLGSPEPRRAIRRPSGTAESESDTPPSKKSKKNRRRRKKNARRRLNPLHVPPSALRGALQNKPVAPFNTTQFLMAEHDQLQDTDIVNRRPRRQRDSSMSMDSDEGDYYSSPEDEEEFLMREFWTAYEDVHAERLDTMTKAQLIQEYVALEERVELLERQLRVVRERHTEDDEESSPVPGELPVDTETAEKIRIFKNEIDTLSHENQRLRQENDFLRRSSSAISSSSSDSEGGSSSSSSSSSSGSSSSSSSEDSSDSEDEDCRRRRVTPAVLPPSEAPCDRAAEAVQEAEATATGASSPCSEARVVEALDSCSVCSSGVPGPMEVVSTPKVVMVERGVSKCSDSGVSSGGSDSSSDPSTSEAASPSSCEPSLGLVASTNSNLRGGEAQVRVKSEGVEEEEEGEGEGAVSSTTQA
ncbi:hexamethylene bisacetamide inducible [Oratosquilla oratoria]|uniref:hexamethylene bisacetamide inducible n=1 Tax=Oratosquilla oratoria TaxID=337810 RepID=UPI003F766B64